MQEECIIDRPRQLTGVRQVRSTLLQSSLNSLRELQLYDRYLERLDPAFREAIVASMAPEWLPLEMAEAHYQACEELELSSEEMLRIGEHVGNRIQGTFLATVVRRARNVGLNPWLPLGHFERLWARLMVGGGVSLYKLAPKDARVEIHNLPLARFDYFRVAFRGVISSGIQLGAGRSVTVKLTNAQMPESRLVFHAMWV